MIQAFITTATDAVPKMFEPGWDWWAWPIAWAVLALAALIMAGALPMIALAVDGLAGSMWRIPAAILVVLLVIAAAVTGYTASGVMMRHMDSGGGAFWVFLGSILVGLIGWGLSTSWQGSGWNYEDRRWLSWVAAVPALVIGVGAVLNGIGEVVTRLAASIPMPVAQFLAIVVVGAALLGLHASTSSRR